MNSFRRLGLKLIVDSLPRYARLECPDGESTLSVNIAEEIALTNKIVLYFECDDLDDKVEELKAAGLVFSEDPTDRDWLWRQAYLKESERQQNMFVLCGRESQKPSLACKIMVCSI